MKRFIPFAVVLIPVLMAGALVAGDEWKKVTDRDGIAVFTKPVPGSPLKAFKGEAFLDAPYETVNEILDDIPSMVRWMPKTPVSELIMRRGDTYLVLYQELSAPWPVSNRDFIVESTVTKKSDCIVRTVKAAGHERYPNYAPRKGKVRITDMEGSWTLWKREKRTFIVYEIRSNPAGSLPASIANSASVDLPFQAIKGLRKMIAERRRE